MKFVHPEILWALGALSIPIIVHLFNFRKFKKVLFSNVEFLKEIKQETQSKSKIKHWLILISRLLALTCIIFAFAQPFIPVAGNTQAQGSRVVSIYVDNSYSMEGENETGRMLDLAKNKAIEITNSFSPTDKFQLLTGDFEGRHQRLVSREEMIDLIQEIQASPSSRKLSEVVSRQKDLLEKAEETQKNIFILSDLQKSVTDIEQVINDSTIQVSLVPESAPNLSNIYIDSLWFESPVRLLNQTEVLKLRLVNTGEELRENIALQLDIDGQQKSVASANVEGKSQQEVEISFSNTEPGNKLCKISIDDNSVVFDDQFYFSYRIAQQTNILEIRGNNATGEAVRTVYSDDPYFIFKSNPENNVDYGSFAANQLIILNQIKVISSGLIAELEKFVNAGGSLVILPAIESELSSYNLLMSKFSLGTINGKMRNENKVSNLNTEHYIFENLFEKNPSDADLPKVTAWYDITVTQKSFSNTMMQLQGGSPFMLSSNAGSGRVYLSAVSPDPVESNFSQHAFFPAIMLRIAEFSQSVTPLYYTLGKEQSINLRNLNATGDGTFKLRNNNDGTEFIPEHRTAAGNTQIFIHSDLKTAGNYLLNWADSTVSVVSLNFSRLESQTESWTADELNEQLLAKGFSNWSILENSSESIGASTSQIAQGKRYWLSMIVWALIFLAIEILLIKYWK